MKARRQQLAGNEVHRSDAEQAQDDRQPQEQVDEADRKREMQHRDHVDPERRIGERDVAAVVRGRGRDQERIRSEIARHRVEETAVVERKAARRQGGDYTHEERGGGNHRRGHDLRSSRPEAPPDVRAAAQLACLRRGRSVFRGFDRNGRRVSARPCETQRSQTAH